MATINGGTLLVTIEGRDVNLTQVLQKIEREMQRGVAAARNYDTTIASLPRNIQRTEAAQAAYAQSLARNATAAGDTAGAIKILASALQTLTPNTTAAVNVLNQLQATLNRQTTAAQQAASATFKASQQQAAADAAANNARLSGITSSISGFQKLVSAYFAVTTAAQAFASAINAGNELEKAQVTFRALSGSTEAYEKNLAAAREQQNRFGGSLQENIDGLSGFANLAKRTGIDIKELANLARGLATIDPVQGFKGASIALKEFFSGEITSLARRFEIPRDALNSLKNIEDPIARFAALKDTLAEFGITQELIAASANTTAVEYEKLKGAATDALASIGQALAQGLTPAAKAATDVLKEVSSGINQLNQISVKKLAVEETMLTASASVDEFNQKVQQVNEQSGVAFVGIENAALRTAPLIGELAVQMNNMLKAGLEVKELTAAQFQFAQSSQAAGIAFKDTQLAIQSTSSSVQLLESQFRGAEEVFGTTAQEVTVFQGAILNAAAASKEGAISANAVAQAVLNHEITVAEGIAILQGYTTGIAQTNAVLAQQEQAERLAAQASAEHTTALGQEALETINASVQTERLKQLQEALASIAGAVSGGHLSNAQAASQLAAQYAITTAEAERLISAQLRLAGLDARGIATNPRRRGQEGGLLGNIGTDTTKAAVSQKFLEDQERRAKAQVDAEIALARAKGETGRVIDLLRQSQQGLNKDSAEYKQIQAQIISQENAAAKKTKAGGGGGGTKSPKLTANEKLNNQLLAQEDKFQNQMEDAETKHQQNLLQIIEDFAKKQLAAQQKNEVDKRRSRFDFYSDLNKSDIAPVDKEKFAAAYEEAFKRAQEIAQQGKAVLANEFLDLKKKHIEELKDLAEEEAQIKSDKDLGKGDRQAQLDELEARRKLLLDAQREEENQLVNGGDSIQNDFNQRIAEENRAYEDQAGKIATAAERAGDAKIVAAQRAKVAVSEENKALADNLSIYEKIARLNGGQLPQTGLPTGTTPANAPSAVPAPIDAPQAIPVKADTPLPIASPESIAVRQLEMFVVRDQGVIDAIGDQTVRLEGRLTEINMSIGNLNTALGGKIDSLKSAMNTRNAVRP